MARLVLKYVCFTVNNYTDEVREQIFKYEHWAYIVIGNEVAETGTPHLQGFGVFHKRRDVIPIAKLWKAHFEKMYSTPKAASDYCKKCGDYTERGDLPEDPKVTAGRVGGAIEKDRWRRIIQLAESGNLEEIKDSEPGVYLRYVRNLKTLKLDAMKPLPEVDLDNYWIWGEPGIGKSRKAREMCNGVFYPKQMNKWWDGYNNEDWIILDDMEKDGAHLGHHLKIWADRYDFIGETKGGSIRIRPKHFIVTSNYSPYVVFEEKEMSEAIRRRFKVIHLTNFP